MKHEHIDILTARARLIRAILGAVNRIGGPDPVKKAISVLKAKIEYQKFKSKYGLK